MVAQVDEEHAAMVADAVAPARKPDGLAGIGLAQGATGMRAIAVHEVVISGSGKAAPTHQGGALLIPAARPCQWRAGTGLARPFPARAVLNIVHVSSEPAATNPEERRFILEGLSAARRGELATDQEIEAAFRRFGH